MFKLFKKVKKEKMEVKVLKYKEALETIDKNTMKEMTLKIQLKLIEDLITIIIMAIILNKVVVIIIIIKEEDLTEDTTTTHLQTISTEIITNIPTPIEDSITILTEQLTLKRKLFI
jgi:hypothetical protein